MAGFPTLAEAGVVDPRGRQDWLHVATFEATILDRANLLFLQRLLHDRFTRHSYALIEEHVGNGRIASIHLAVLPDPAITEALDQVLGEDDDIGRLDESTYWETADAVCQECWRSAHMAYRIELADEAGLSSRVTLSDDMPAEVRKLIYQDIDE